jgi:hypothetical protein
MRGLRKRAVVAAAACLIAGATTAALPVLHVQATTCIWPGYYKDASGDTFQDGIQPTANSDTNTCDGGTPGYQGDDGHVYFQWYYAVGLPCGGCSNSSEQDITVTARSWQCGNLAYDNGPVHWSTANSLTTAWYSMGNEGDYGKDFCGDQHDFSVKVTAWDGETWSTYLNEEDEGCSFDRCPTG